MDNSTAEAAIFVVSQAIGFLKRHLEFPDVEDLNKWDKKKKAADYFVKKGEKRIEELILNYDGFTDPEFVQNEIFARMKIENDLCEKIYGCLSNPNDWKMRRGALIVIRNATVGAHTNILEKVIEISRSDDSFQNRIEAYGVLFEKLCGRSVSHLLWGIENDPYTNVRLDCIDKLSRLGTYDSGVITSTERRFRDKGESKEITGKLIWMCGELKMKEFFDRLIGFLDGDDLNLSEMAANALFTLCDNRALSYIEEKCLQVCDVCYRQRILIGFVSKKGSKEAKQIVERYGKRHPDEKSVVSFVLRKLYEQGGR